MTERVTIKDGNQFTFFSTEEINDLIKNQEKKNKKLRKKLLKAKKKAEKKKKKLASKNIKKEAKTKKVEDVCSNIFNRTSIDFLHKLFRIKEWNKKIEGLITTDLDEISVFGV